MTDWQPVPIDGEEGTGQREVERIVCDQWKKRGRGYQHWVRVKWSGYRKETWELARSLHDTPAWDAFLRSGRLSPDPRRAFNRPSEGGEGS